MSEFRTGTIAFGVVLMLCATAFIGMCMVSEDSEASFTAGGNTTRKSPASTVSGSFRLGDMWNKTTVYVYSGASVNVSFSDTDEIVFTGVYVSANSTYQEVPWDGSLTVDGITVSFSQLSGNSIYTVAITGAPVKNSGLTDIKMEFGWPDSGDEDSLIFEIYECPTDSYNVTIGTPFTLDLNDDPDLEIFDVDVNSGQLPPGLTVNDSGVISGTPTAMGTYYVMMTAKVTDGYDEGDNYVYLKFVIQQSSYTHTVTYAANGGSGTTANTVVTDQVSGASNVTLASNGFTKSGYHFVGWKIGNTVYQPGQTISVNGNASVTATAQWEQNTLTLGTVAKQYAVAGKSVSFNASATSNPSGATITFAKSNVSSGLNVLISGNVVTCSAANAGTYTFTLTAIASGYTSSSTTVTVQVVPVLAFTNSPSAGALNA